MNIIVCVLPLTQSYYVERGLHMFHCRCVPCVCWGGSSIVSVTSSSAIPPYSHGKGGVIRPAPPLCCCCKVQVRGSCFCRNFKCLKYGILSNFQIWEEFPSHRALQEADVILLLGARLNWILHFGLKPRFREDVKIIQVPSICPCVSVCNDMCVWIRLTYVLKSWEIMSPVTWCYMATFELC